MSNYDAENFRFPESAFPVPVILDTDTYNEIDDQFALAYALIATDRVNLIGVTAAPFFNSRSTSAGDGMEKSYEEILRVIDIVQKPTPAYRGSDRFMPNRTTPVDSPAARFIIEQAKAYGARGLKLYVLAIGAVTNVASALLLAPEIANDIVVIWLGGHELDRPNPREFNLAGDVFASQVLFSSPMAFFQIPCENVANNLGTVPEEVKAGLQGCGAAGEYLEKIFIDYYYKYNFTIKVIWDISTVAALSVPSSTSWKVIQRPVLQDDCHWEGTSELKMAVATHIDRDCVYADLYGRLRNWKGIKA